MAPISRADGDKLVERFHYSHRVVMNTQLHLGVFIDGRAEGIMQFGPSMDKRKLVTLVQGTEWCGFIELNRMAFGPALPRNSESRALGVAMRLLRKTYPQLEWVVSFADGTQCGDGTIYRASGFVLTHIGKNASLYRLPDGTARCKSTFTQGPHILQTGGASIKTLTDAGAVKLPGFQLRYLYFLNPAARARLTVPVIPFDEIDRAGARMYLGKPLRAKQAMAGPTGTAEG